MPEIKTKFTDKQIADYAEMHNLLPLNVEALVVNQMRLEGMIQELQMELSLLR